MFQYVDPDTPCRVKCHYLPPASNVMRIPLLLSHAELGYILKIYSEIYRKGIIYPFSMNRLPTAASTLYLRYIHIKNAVKNAIAAGAGKGIIYVGSHATTAKVNPIPAAKRYSIGELNRTGVTIPAGYFQA